MNGHRWGDAPINLIDAAMACEPTTDQVIAWDYLQANTPSSVLKQFGELYGSLIPHDRKAS